MADVERSAAASHDVDGPMRRRSSRTCTIMAQEKVAVAAAAAVSVTKSYLSSSALVKAEKAVPGETDQQRERRALRSMWELACVINFLNVFRSVVKIRTGFHADELETSLMNPNGLIKDLHIDLLKGIPPMPRVPIDKNNWAAVLCAKLRDRWSQVSDGVCPLMAAKGEEEAAYNTLSAAARLRILRAVCEMRLDTDDVRGAMDETIKQGEPPSSFQLQPLAVDNSGCTYWYEDDETVGSRLYREIPSVPSKSKTRGLGRRAPPPAAPIWETIATNVEEFQEIGERLSNSRNKPEAKLGKYIFEDLLPCLEERERKREKAVKKQQRQQLLLQSIMNGVGLAAGRSRRERKIVSYTFEEFDKSINEAIKWTKRGSADRNGHSAREVAQAERPKSSRRPRVASSRYGDQFVHIDEVEEEDEFGDDDIEGEAIYDEEYLEIRRQQLDALRASTTVKRRGSRNGVMRRGPDSDDEDYKCGSVVTRPGEQRHYDFRDGFSVHRLRQCSVLEDLQWGVKRSSRRRSGSEDETDGRLRGRSSRLVEDNNHHPAEAGDLSDDGDYCDGNLRYVQCGIPMDNGGNRMEEKEMTKYVRQIGQRENGGGRVFEEDENMDAFEDRGCGVKRRRLAELSVAAGQNGRERGRRSKVDHERGILGDMGIIKSSDRVNALKGHIAVDRLAYRTFEDVHYGYRFGELGARRSGRCDERENDIGEDYLERKQVRQRDFAAGNLDNMREDYGDSDEEGD